jgi:hypothetical protein
MGDVPKGKSIAMSTPANFLTRTPLTDAERHRALQHATEAQRIIQGKALDGKSLRRAENYLSMMLRALSEPQIGREAVRS